MVCPVSTTRVLPIDPLHPEPQIIEQAAQLLRAGQVVAFPTETVYGLGANAFDEQAVARIFAAKGRPANDPIIVHIAAHAQLAGVSPASSGLIERLTAQFWPGPLTLVLPRGPRIPPNVAAGLPTVAVRMPAHPVALALIRAAGVPIAAPSANLFAHASPTTAQHVYDDLAGRIPLILDGGPTHVGVESTILDLSGEHPRLLRPGGVPLPDLQAAMQHELPGMEIEIVQRYVQSMDTSEIDADEAMPAPGMLLRHYSPRAELRLYDGTDEAVCRALSESAAVLIAAGQKVGLLVADEDRARLAGHIGPEVALVALGPLADLHTIARGLFAGLRALDAQGVDVILARTFPAEGLGLAVRDRLIRAAVGRVIRVG